MDDIEHRRIYPLFFRKNDLAILNNRASKSGITFIASRPQMGKALLIVKLLHNLKIKNGHCKHLIGYSEATNDDHFVNSYD